MGQCIPCGTVKYYTYPNGCTTSSSKCTSAPLPSASIIYSGPNLPNTGIETNMLLTEALQRIDVQLKPTEIFALLIEAIDNNPALLTILCDKIGTCP